MRYGPATRRKSGHPVAVVVAAAVLAGVVICCVVLSQMPPARAPVVVLDPPTLLPRVLAYPQTDALPPPEPSVASAPHEAVLTKGQQVEVLAKSGSASDAFAAFQILRLCAMAQSPARIAPGIGGNEVAAKLCQAVTPGQMAIRDALLKQAVEARVEGAAFYARRTTPDGRPAVEAGDDPAHADWKRVAQQHVEEAASRGDALAIMQMAIETGRTTSAGYDASRALTYWTAYAEKLAAEDPRYVDNPQNLMRLRAETREREKEYGQGLSADAVAAAIAKGHAMAVANSQ